jgi:hypothetical protein
VSSSIVSRSSRIAAQDSHLSSSGKTTYQASLRRILTKDMSTNIYPWMANAYDNTESHNDMTIYKIRGNTESSLYNPSRCPYDRLILHICTTTCHPVTVM